MTTDQTACWYNIALTPGLGPAAAQKVARFLHQRRIGACEVVSLDELTLQTEAGLSPGLARALLSQLADPAPEPDLADGVRILTPGADHFPTHRFLEANPPLVPVLYAVGDTSLLARTGNSLAVAGSRHTSDDVLELVTNLSREASAQGWLVVSGLAKGVDSAAHQGAVLGGTGTVGVLASGISNTAGSWLPDEADGVCVVSQFDAADPWSGPRAMQRNPTIAALADRVLIASSGISGGSWEMGQLCLRRRKPLFVFDLPPELAPGNQALIRSGAVPVEPGSVEGTLAELDAPPTLFT